MLQVDGYAGFERLTLPGDIVLAACWAHARRKFSDLHEATGSPIAAEALRRIAELYAIEGSIRGRTAEERQHVRYTSVRPLIEMMKPWLEMELGRVPPAGPLAEAFLDDGRIELDNNPVERAIRPIALGRKNHLFAGSDGGGVRWATVCSLIATARSAMMPTTKFLVMSPNSRLIFRSLLGQGFTHRVADYNHHWYGGV